MNFGQHRCENLQPANVIVVDLAEKKNSQTFMKTEPLPCLQGLLSLLLVLRSLKSLHKLTPCFCISFNIIIP